MHTLYWYGRTLYSAVYHHTFIKICCVRARRRWCRDRGPVINIVAVNPVGSPGSNPVINEEARQ